MHSNSFKIFKIFNFEYQPYARVAATTACGGLYLLVETEGASTARARLMIEIDKAVNPTARGRTDIAKHVHEIIVLDPCTVVLGSAVNKRLFSNFPDKVWLIAALRAAYRYECKKQGQKRHQEPGAAKTHRVAARSRPTRAKRVDQRNNQITANANDGTQTPSNNGITEEEAVGPHPLLPLDINPQWKEQCPATFPRMLKTLDEAGADSRYLELWKERLPEVGHETTDRAPHISGMMFPVIRTRGKQQSFIVREGGQDVLDTNLRDTCVGKALYQLHRQNIDEGENLCVIRNVVLKEACQMSLSSAWAQGAQLCRQEPAEGQSFIAASKGIGKKFKNMIFDDKEKFDGVRFDVIYNLDRS